MEVALYIIALVLLLLAAFAPQEWPKRVHLGWLGLALWLFTFALLPHLT